MLSNSFSQSRTVAGQSTSISAFIEACRTERKKNTPPFSNRSQLPPPPGTLQTGPAAEPSQAPPARPEGRRQRGPGTRRRRQEERGGGTGADGRSAGYPGRRGRVRTATKERGKMKQLRASGSGRARLPARDRAGSEERHRRDGANRTGGPRGVGGNAAGARPLTSKE